MIINMFQSRVQSFSSDVCWLVRDVRLREKWCVCDMPRLMSDDWSTLTFGYPSVVINYVQPRSSESMHVKELNDEVPEWTNCILFVLFCEFYCQTFNFHCLSSTPLSSNPDLQVFPSNELWFWPVVSARLVGRCNFCVRVKTIDAFHIRDK